MIALAPCRRCKATGVVGEKFCSACLGDGDVWRRLTLVERTCRAVRALLVMLAACNVPDPVPPNVGALCDRAVACDVFDQLQTASCVACLEHWGDQVNEELKTLVPPVDEITCDVLAYVAQHKRIAECVAEGWWQ